MISIRPYQPQETLPDALLDHGMPYLVPEWSWVIEHEGTPFALIVGSFAHGWFMLWRVLSIRSKGVSLYWLLEALPQILQTAKERGCVGFLSLLADNKPVEAQLARIVLRQGGNLIPFKGSIAVGLID